MTDIYKLDGFSGVGNPQFGPITVIRSSLLNVHFKIARFLKDENINIEYLRKLPNTKRYYGIIVRSGNKYLEFTIDSFETLIKDKYTNKLYKEVEERSLI